MKKNNDVILFGTGSSADTVFAFLSKIGINVWGFTDNNPNLWGTEKQGKEIIPPEKLKCDGHVVVIASMYKKEISQQLMAMGFKEHETFLYYENFQLKNNEYCYVKGQLFFPTVASTFAKKSETIPVLSEQSMKPFVQLHLLDDNRYPNFMFPIQVYPTGTVSIDVLKQGYTIGYNGKIYDEKRMPLKAFTSYSMVNMGLWDGRRWQNHVEEEVPKPQLLKVDGILAVTTTRWSGTNYYHWLFEELPRFYLLQQVGVIIDTYVSNYKEVGYQKASLDALNIDCAKIVSSSDAYGFQADMLYAPYTPYYDSGYVATWVCNFLRETFLQKSTLSKGKRIYVMRGETKYRKVINEAALIQLLQRYEFEIVEMSQYSIYEQASIFNTADIIISAHGAALSNVVFCKEGAKLVEIFNPLYMPTMYWGIASQVGMEYYCSLGKNLDTHFNETTTEILLAKDIEVELSQIEKFLKEYL